MLHNICYKSWKSSDKIEKVKAVTLLSCRIQQHFIRDVPANFGILYSPQSSVTGQNSDRGISDFQISGQSLIKQNGHNSRASDDIDMKLGPVTKIDKKSKQRQKKLTKRHAAKLWHHCYFSNLWPIWIKPVAGFRTHSL